MCECDLERPALFEQVARKARKPHECGECKRTIKPAETYIVSSGLYKSSWFNHKHCSDCELIAKKLQEHDGEGCYCLGELYEALIHSELIINGHWVHTSTDFSMSGWVEEYSST